MTDPEFTELGFEPDCPGDLACGEHSWRVAFESPLALVQTCAHCPAAKVVAPLGLGPIAAVLETLIRSEAARTATILETHGLVKISNIHDDDFYRHGWSLP